MISDVGAPAPRRRNLEMGAWTGNELVVWGGADPKNNVFADGARYDPSLDAWAPMSDSGKPAARAGHVLASAAGRVIVWGGGTLGAAYFADGRRYDPQTNEWSVMAASPLAPRDMMSFAASSTRVYVWGGYLDGGPTYSGASYDVAADKWTALPSSNAPAARGYAPSAVAALGGADVFMLAGGRGSFGSGVVHGDGASTLDGLSTWFDYSLSPLAPRFDHTLVAAPGKAIIWGGSAGFDEPLIVGDGAWRDLASQTWIPLSITLAPGPRSGHGAIWTGKEMIVWGGCDGTQCFADGARYDLAKDAWAPLPPAPIEPRAPASMVWTGSEVIVWGGCDIHKQCFQNGARFRP